jgi:hypothetical protein
MGFVVRRKRLLTRLAIGVVIVALLAMSNLWWSLWQVSGAQGTFSMARALPACSGQTLLEGFTYHFRDPHRGEIVTFHARGAIGSEITPDSDSRELEINKRVIGIPGDTVVGRDNRVYVNGARRTTSQRSPPICASRLEGVLRHGRQSERLARQPWLRIYSAGGDLRPCCLHRVASRSRWRAAIRQVASATRALCGAG